MTRIVGRLLAILLLFPTTSSAHRLDEYLQATRVSVVRERIALEVDLVPGANLASDVVALIDRDGDDQVRPDEARRYGNTVIADIVLMLDGRRLSLTLTEVQVPAIAVMRDGMGVIRIAAAAAVNASAGRHELFYRNDHQPHVSAYLVNALIPGTRALSIVGQRRDVRQREFHLDYVVTGSSSAIAWSMGALFSLAALAVSRTRVNASTRSAR